MEKYINQIVAIDTILSNPPDAHYPVWFAEQIGNLPAADVIEVVHVEWETADTPLGHYYICSVWSDFSALEHKYCPYCGAKMGGGKG